jgi:hypothetical protein
LFGVMIRGSTHDLNGIEFVSRDVGMESKNGTGSGDWTGRIMKWWNLARADDATSTVVPRAGGVSSTPCFFGSHWRLWNTGSSAFADDDNRGDIASNMPSHSRGATPEFCLIVSLKREGAGNAGCPMHPQPVCKKTHTVVATGSPESSGIPCAMVLTAYSALSPATSSFLSPSSAN